VVRFLFLLSIAVILLAACGDSSTEPTIEVDEFATLGSPPGQFVMSGTADYFVTGAALAADGNGDGRVDHLLVQPVSVTLGGVPASASVVRALLYWGGTQAQADGSPACSSSADPLVSCGVAGAGTPATADASFCSGAASPNYDVHVSRADVTSIVQAGGVSASYEVSGYAGLVADNSADNASFSLVIFYEDTLLPYRRFVLKEDLWVMWNSTRVLTISGFDVSTAPQGDLAWYTLDGDDWVTDGAERVDVTARPGASGPITVSDAVNPATNPMNRTINVTTPPQTGTIGLDIDRFDITATLTAGDTEVDITYYAGPDKWWTVYSIVGVTETPPLVLAPGTYGLEPR